MDFDISDNLNKIAHELLKGNLIERYTPYEGDLSMAVQLMPNVSSDDVFILKSPVSGLLKNIIPIKDIPKDTDTLLRIPIAYSMIVKFENDLNQFNYYMYNLINKALGAIVKIYGGDVSSLEVISELPGLSGKYFKHMEDNACVELRFFAHKKQ